MQSKSRSARYTHGLETNEVAIRTDESNIEQDTAFGRVDAFVMDRVSSAQVIAESPMPLQLAGQPFSEIRNALPFRDDDTERARAMPYADRKNGMTSGR